MLLLFKSRGILGKVTCTNYSKLYLIVVIKEDHDAQSKALEGQV